jgi:hypothetical protein
VKGNDFNPVGFGALNFGALWLAKPFENRTRV